ncbi:NrfD/PsrC family molybdoenzyme membrane anchor subunit [Carboxydochorda subterranea]|uniref:NrfD/PsrC family molybdoenzyme membrane anchor subunit n=1 Tax=Carboxydichorda subterranea TaxID=3109565 RepID=A0ABZ1BXY3_9FIRM|nr:NrfD/PsrC family molybdoenzyme membrane anchor subunit [Limnochorda sp. L945t]WRP17573.1 NrfD/PsrC family molybdoenzyme membrane anchor subunit [Limnochorda sp. L945t]
MRPYWRPAANSSGSALGAVPAASGSERAGLVESIRPSLQAAGPVRLAMGLVVAAALVAAGYRMIYGLGAATHLSDAWPWGLWKILGVVAGIPLAAGAFVVAAWVHVFRHHGYESLARPAVLAGFIGYLTAIASLFVDIGQPHRIWHPIVMWQPHSVLFEVCWCVILYTTVLALEFSPVAFEKLGWQRAGRIVQHFIAPIAGAGATLCVLHQSSLGSLFLIAPSRMSPMWYTPWLPLIFFVSSVAAGLAVLQLLAWVADRVYGQPVAESIRAGLARGLTGVLVLYLAVRLGDWSLRGTGPWRTSWGLEGALAWAELVMGIVLPLALLLAAGVRAGGQEWRVAAAAFTAAGVLLHRLDTGLTSMREAAWLPYVPSAIEWLVMAGMVCAGILAYDWVARRLPLFEHGREAAR